MNRRRTRLVAVLMAGVLVLALVGGLLAATSDPGVDGRGGEDGQELVERDLPPPVTQVSDLPAVPADELPPEAFETLALIAEGGPFPYDRDGLTFQNREGLLPPHPEGWYREYTVPTPGEPDRGARRLVVGQQGEVFYTEDHYESFREVVSA